MIDRIFFVDYADSQRRHGFRDPIDACRVAVMLMFMRVGLPLLTLLVVLWKSLEWTMPGPVRLDNLTQTQVSLIGALYVLIVYAWLSRRYFDYALTPLVAQGFDTPSNRRNARLSFMLSVASPVLGWAVLKM